MKLFFLLVAVVGTAAAAPAAAGGVKIPAVLANLTKPAPASNETDTIAALQPSEVQLDSPYHIETKSIHYLLDGIAAKIKSQHDKVRVGHEEHMHRVG